MLYNIYTPGLHNNMVGHAIKMTKYATTAKKKVNNNLRMNEAND